MAENIDVRQKKPVQLTAEIVKTFICPLANDQEIYFFLQLCSAQNLNPFLKEAYLIKYAEKSPAAMVIGKETFLKRANRHPEYKGFEPGVIVSQPDKDGTIIKYNKGGIVLPGQTLLGGWAEVFRSDRDIPFRVEVQLEEYIGLKEIWAPDDQGRDKPTGQFEPNKMWAGKKATMIRKVAVVQALREAFPQDLGGMIAAEELPYIDVTLPTYSLDKPAPGHIEPPRQKPHTISDPSKPASDGQLKAIATLLNRCEIRGEEIQHNYVGLLLKREIKSFRDLLMGEASSVIEELNKKVNAPPAENGR